MYLSNYHMKYVRIKTIYGDTVTGLARYENYEYLKSEWGGKEDGVIIEDFIIYNSQIESIDETEVHGTAEIWTENLILRKYVPEDVEQLHHYLGKDPEMSRYSGWNPYATMEMTMETVQGFIGRYNDDHFYSWVMDVDDVVVGTIGAYDYENDRIEVGFSVVKGWQGRGFATGALKEILRYLTENEGIPCVTAWCASENTASRSVLEKSGMKLVHIEKAGLTIDDKVYDKMTYEYRRQGSGSVGATD